MLKFLFYTCQTKRNVKIQLFCYCRVIDNNNDNVNVPSEMRYSAEVSMYYTMIYYIVVLVLLKTILRDKSQLPSSAEA